MAPDSESKQQPAAHRLPPEVLIEIFKFAFPTAFKPNVLPLAFCKGSRKNYHDTLIIGHQHALIDQTQDTRALLALCPFSRRLVLNAKPHKLTFATRRFRGKVEQSADGRCTLYRPEALFTQKNPGLVYFNGSTDIVLIDNVYLSITGNRMAELPFQAPTGLGGEHIQLLNLQLDHRRLQESTTLHWDEMITACPNLKKLYISQKDSQMPVKLHTGFAIFRSAKVFDHHYTNQGHLVCYPKGNDQISWGLNQAGLTRLPLTFRREFNRYNARAVKRVPDDCQVLKAFEFTISQIAKLKTFDDQMDQFRGTPPV